MNPLVHFRWYRRWRGGVWGRHSALLHPWKTWTRFDYRPDDFSERLGDEDWRALPQPDELADTAARSADYLRRAIKSETKCEVLELKLEAARRELAKVNNEFGSETADWPEPWRRVAEVKERAGRLWRDNEALRAALTVVVRDWTEQFERTGHLAPAWVKQAREALGPNASLSGGRRPSA